VKHKTYPDQHTPAIHFSDLSFDGLDMSDKGHLIEHLAPTGSQWFLLCCGRVGTLERIKIVDDILIKLHVTN